MVAWKICLRINDDLDVVGGARGRGRPRQRPEKQTARSRTPALRHGEQTCLRLCLEVLIDQVITGYDCGPHRALSDGNKMLERFSYIVTPTCNRFLLQDGRYLIFKRKHYRAFISMWSEVFVLTDNKIPTLLDESEVLDIVNDKEVTVFDVTYVDPSEDYRDWVAWWYSDQDLLGGGSAEDSDSDES